jgi:hypothetical protein
VKHIQSAQEVLCDDFALLRNKVTSFDSLLEALKSSVEENRKDLEESYATIEKKEVR